MMFDTELCIEVESHKVDKPDKGCHTIYVDLTYVAGEENYGADADGHRGMMMPFCDLEDMGAMVLSWFNAKKKAWKRRPIDYDKMSADHQKVVDKAIDDNDPEVPVEDEPEEDDDFDKGGD